MVFTEVPYFKEPAALAVLQTNPLNKVDRVDDLRNLTIGYAKGGVLTPMMKNERLHFELISNPDYHAANIKKLDLGRIDAVYAPSRSILIHYIQKLDLTERVKLLELPDTKSTYYIVFSKLAPELAIQYNAAFKKIGGQQFYIEKLRKYIDMSSLQ